MPAWKWDPTSYDGVSLTAAPFLNARFEWSDPTMNKLRRKPVELAIPGDYSFPNVARGQMGSAYATLHFEMSAWQQTDIYTIRRLFDRYKGGVYLIVTDGDTLTWRTIVHCEELVEEAANRYRVRLYIPRPVWERNATANDSRTINASPTSFDLTPGGSVRAYPEFVLDPSAQKAATDDFRNRWQVTIAWRSELPGEDSEGRGYPIDVANDALDTAAENAAGRLQADGDDLRVFVDGVQYPRILDGVATATCKVWVPIHFSPMKAALLAAASGAGTPATGGNWDILEGESLEDWPAQGSFLVDTERVFYGRRTETQFQLIRRGFANTAAAAHAAGATGYWVEHDIQIVSNWSAAPTPTSTDYLASMGISVSASTNEAHAINVFLRSATLPQHGRPLLRFTEDNSKAAALSVQPTTQARFADNPAGGTYVPYNNFEFYVPCGVKAAASALSFALGGSDISGALTVGGDIAVNLRLFGVDTGGVERLLATYDKNARTGALTFQPDTVLQRVRWNAIYNVITGAYREGSGWADKVLGKVALLTNQDQNAQSFYLNQHTTIQTVAIMCRENAAGDTGDVLVWIRAGGASPATADEIPLQSIFNASLLTTHRWNAYATNPMKIPQGQHYLMINGLAGSAGTTYVVEYQATYVGGSFWDQSAAGPPGIWSDQGLSDLGFLLIGDGSVVQDEAPSGLGGYASLDDLVITFDNTTPRTPLYLRAAQENIYPIRTRIEHVDLGFYIDVFYLAALTDTLTIRPQTKEVFVAESQNWQAPNAVTPSDPEEWFYLKASDTAADNTIRITETGVTGLGISTTWRAVLG